MSKLTDERIDAIWRKAYAETANSIHVHREFARAIEAELSAAQPDTNEATADQCIELAGALEIEWTRKAIAEAKALGARLHEGPFSYGWESACEEIETRIGTGFPIDAAQAESNKGN